MTEDRPVKLGIAGLGGYARDIRRGVLALASAPNPPLRLVAACEPDLTTHAAAAVELRAVGIHVYDSLDAMLAHDIEAVWLPVPIDLHRPFAEKSLAAGKAVMCEKPAAGVVDDLDAMIAARDRTGLPCAIGFQSIYQASTIEMKRRLLAGDMGPIHSASVVACWPRDSRYYGRSTWAGRVKRGDTWVLDSPASNALSHQINLLLFLLGATLYESASPESVEAELYRARPIENYDTISLRVRLPGGVPLLVLFTHACATTVGPIIDVTGEKGALQLGEGQARLTTPAGAEDFGRGDARPHMFERFANLVRGRADERAVATLEVARAHLVAVNGASESTRVHDLPAELVRPVTNEHGGTVLTIPGIEGAFVECARRGQMLHESGLASWSRPPGTRDVRNYEHFAGLPG